MVKQLSKSSFITINYIVSSQSTNGQTVYNKRPPLLIYSSWLEFVSITHACTFINRTDRLKHTHTETHTHTYTHTHTVGQTDTRSKPLLEICSRIQKV